MPVSLGALRAPLLAAGVTRPDDRPDSSQFTRMLLIAAEQLDRPAPLVLAGATVHDHDVVADRDPTVMLRSDPAPGSEPDILSAPPGTVIDGIRVIPDRGDAPAPGGAVPLTRLVPDGDGDDLSGGAERAPRRRRKWRVVTLSLLLVAALVVAAGVWWFDVRVPTHTVPSLRGTNVATLQQRIGSDHWVVQRTAVSRDHTLPGQILAQSPAAGTHLKENGVLTLVVSTGPPPVPVPQDLAGRTLVAARSELQADELALGAVTYQFDEEKPVGVVLGLAPGVPSQMPKGAKVPLVVSKGAKPRTVPSIAVGTPVATATATLNALGLHVTTTAKSDEHVPAGQVLSVPAAGTQVPKGATVDLIVSSGPPTVVIPSKIIGKTRHPGGRGPAGPRPDGHGIHGSPLRKVKGTDPGVGKTVRKGTPVVLITHR